MADCYRPNVDRRSRYTSARAPSGLDCSDRYHHQSLATHRGDYDPDDTPRYWNDKPNLVQDLPKIHPDRRRSVFVTAHHAPPGAPTGPRGTTPQRRPSQGLPERANEHPSMDPRLRKRKPSRSPDGGSEPKIPKAWPLRDGSATPNARDGSRHSSISGASSPHSASAAAKSRSLHSNERTFTAERAPAAIMVDTPRMAPTAVEEGEIIAIDLQETLTKTIVAVSLEMTTVLADVAALKVTLQNSEKTLARANADYRAAEKDFANFPYIKEQMSAAVSKARNDFTAAGQHVESRQKDTHNLAASLGQAIATSIANQVDAKPLKEPSLDVVPRADFDLLTLHNKGLREDVAKLIDDVKAARLQNDKTKKDLEDMNSRTQKLDSTVAQVKIEQEKASESAELVAAKLKVDQLVQKSAELEARIDKDRQRFEKFAASVMGDNDELDSPLDGSSSLQKVLVANSRALGQTQARVAKTEKTLKDFELVKIQQRVQDHRKLIDDLTSQVDSIKGDQGPDRLHRSEDIEQRVQNQGQLIDNLISQVGAIEGDLTTDRLHVLGVGMEKLEGDIETLRNRPEAAPIQHSTGATPFTTQITHDVTEFRDRLTSVEAKLAIIQEEAELKDELVDRHIDEKETSIREDINIMKSELQGDLSARAEALEAFEALVAETKRDLAAGRNTLQSSYSDYSNARKLHMDGAQSLIEHAKTLKEMQEKITKIEEDVQSMHKRTLAPPAKVGFQPLLSNQTLPVTIPGAGSPSPYVNGFSPAPRADGSIYGSPFSNIAQPPYKPGTPVDPIPQIHHHLLALDKQVQHLKQRYDNLTTPEIVQQMAIQFSEMYPSARDFQSSVSVIHQNLQAITHKLAQMDTSQDDVEQRLSMAKASGDGAVKAIEELRRSRSSHEASQSGANSIRQLGDVESQITNINNRLSEEMQGVQARMMDVYGKLMGYKDTLTQAIAAKSEAENLSERTRTKMEAFEVRAHEWAGDFQEARQTLEKHGKSIDALCVELGSLKGSTAALLDMTTSARAADASKK